jgi:Yip1-like protein
LLSRPTIHHYRHRFDAAFHPGGRSPVHVRGVQLRGMAPEMNSTLEPEPARLGEFSRLTGVLFEPAKTFAEIAERPGWAVPLAVVMLFSLVYIYAFSVHVGWERAILKATDPNNNPRIAQLSPDVRQQIIDRQLRFAPVFGYVGVLLFAPLYYLLASGIFLGIIKGLLGAPIRFKQAFAAMSYGSAMPRVIFYMLSIAVMFLKSPDDFDLQNPFLSNPGAVLSPETTPKFLYSLGGSLDVFSIWVILLIAVGLKAAGGKRLSYAEALFAVALPWTVYVLGRASLASIFNFG